MKKNNPRPTMPRHEAGEKQHEPPSPAALIERRKAEAAAARNPLAYALGEPLPGRSALDKMRAREAAAAAGESDNVIALDRRSHGMTNRISPGRFTHGGRKQPMHYD